jgi:hypothetical protein
MGFRPRGPFGPYAMMPARDIDEAFFRESLVIPCFECSESTV